MTPMLLHERPTSLLTPEPIEDTSRREFITGVGAAALAAAFLAACGDGDDGAPSGTSETSDASTTRRIETPRGPVDVPVDAKRVVVFDRRGTLGYLLDLGVRPIAAMSAPQIYGGTQFHPLLDSDVEGIATLDASEPDLEQIASLSPDLIVGFTSDSAMEDAYARLSEIAPTVAVPINFNQPEEELMILGEIFGLEEQAAGLRAAFEGDLARATEGIGDPGTVSIVLPVEDAVRIYGPGNLVGRIVTEFGAEVVPDYTTLTEDDSLGNAAVSLEQVSAITGETIVFLSNLSDAYQEIRDTLLVHPVFQQVPTVAAGRIIEVESQAVFGTAGLRGQRQILDQLAAAFS